jgi:hypothetical protein
VVTATTSVFAESQDFSENTTKDGNSTRLEDERIALDQQSEHCWLGTRKIKRKQITNAREYNTVHNGKVGLW